MRIACVGFILGGLVGLPWSLTVIVDGARAHLVGVRGVMTVSSCVRESTGRHAPAYRRCTGDFRSDDLSVVITQVTLADGDHDAAHERLPVLVSGPHAGRAWRAGNWLWWTDTGMLTFASVFGIAGGIAYLRLDRRKRREAREAADHPATRPSHDRGRGHRPRQVSRTHIRRQLPGHARGPE
jgi:hypothetical protein